MSGVPGTIAQLIGSSGVLASQTADNAGEITMDTTVDPVEGFVRVEVRRGAATDPTAYSLPLPMVALTNTIFCATSEQPRLV